MRLLVVGASGFLGRNMIQEARRRRWDVIGTYHKDASFPRFARAHEVEAIRYDFLGPAPRWDADACIYVAGNSSHLDSIRDPLGDLRANAEALHRFVRSFPGGLVFLSSAAVYDGHRGLVGPGTPVHPRLPYAVSKFACERYLDHYVARGDLAWATVLRLYYAYGPFDRSTRLVPRLVQASQAGEAAFRVTAPPGSKIDPLYSADVAYAALSAARGRAAGETLDLCGGRPRSVSAFVREAARLQGWRVRIIGEPRANETPLRFYSDPRRARRRLGLAPFISLDRGLRGYLRWRAREAG